MPRRHQVVSKQEEDRFGQVSAVLEFEELQDVREPLCARLVLDLLEVDGELLLAEMVDDVQNQAPLDAERRGHALVGGAGHHLRHLLGLLHEVLDDVEVLRERHRGSTTAELPFELGELAFLAALLILDLEIGVVEDPEAVELA